MSLWAGLQKHLHAVDLEDADIADLALGRGSIEEKEKSISLLFAAKIWTKGGAGKDAEQGICPACEQHFEIEPYHAVVERRADDSRATAKCCARNAIDGSRINYYPKKTLFSCICGKKVVTLRPQSDFFNSTINNSSLKI